MLSDEEKKAIEYFNTETRTEEMHYGAVLVNLIEKQQKEIEELKEDKYGLEEEVQIQAKQLIEIDGNYISKEESKQKEKQAWIEGTNVADKLCNKMWKDKIKAKIEECENKIKKIRSKKLINEPEDTIIITRYAHYVSVLQSLLEKE